jgi:hypothetical protein
VARNPTKLNPADIDISSIPLAGHLTGIGKKIIELGSRKAVFVTTFDWDIGEKQDPRNHSPFKMSNFSSVSSRPGTSFMHNASTGGGRITIEDSYLYSRDKNKASHIAGFSNGSLKLPLGKPYVATENHSPNSKLQENNLKTVQF